MDTKDIAIIDWSDENWDDDMLDLEGEKPEILDPMTLIGDNTEFFKLAKEALTKDLEILNYGNIFMHVSPRLSDYLESDQHSKMIRNLRKQLREEGILFPVISCNIDWGDQELGDDDFSIEMPGGVKKAWKLPDYLEENEKALMDVADEMLGVIVEGCGRLFADYDFEGEVFRMEKDGSSECLKMLLNFYRIICPDKKRFFHTTKKLAARNIPSAGEELVRLYRRGEGCERNQKLSCKSSIYVDRNEYRDFFIY